MDLGAYAQIDSLEKIMKDNGIEVPRLRGLRLMKDEKLISKESMDKMVKYCEIMCVEDLCTSEPFWNPNGWCSTYDKHTRQLRDYYLFKNNDGEYIGIRWDRIHGWKRKVLKFEIKKYKRKIQQQYDMWNKYAGRNDVLYIHARIGGNNWNYFDGEKLRKKLWFLDKVDDSSDSTYCDIYAKIVN